MFERDAPIAMAMGMTYHDYWYGPATMLTTYREYNALKRKQKDEEAWLHGLYVYQAFKSVISGLFSSKSSDTIEYPEEPLLSQQDDRGGLSAEEREQQEMVAARLHMEAMKAAGKNWGKQ